MDNDFEKSLMKMKLTDQPSCYRVSVRKRKLTDDCTSSCSSSGPLLRKRKLLRRLPNVCSRILQLPVPSDTNVSVEEAAHGFRFAAEAHALDPVDVCIVQIYPGVTNVVVGRNGKDELDPNFWRFRLPESAYPELTTAIFRDGELVVTVPKGGQEGDSGIRREGGGHQFDRNGTT